MKRNHFRGIIIASLLCLFGCSSLPTNKTPETMSHVDLNRYSGKWYEIASFPNSFQKKCECTTAEYIPSKNDITVINQCFRYNKFDIATGKAWAVEGENNAKLKVQFFWPFRGDYWILYVSKNYELAMVGSPDHKYLWVLSRTPEISHLQLEQVIHIATQQGYDVKKLRLTPQHCYLTQ